LPLIRGSRSYVIPAEAGIPAHKQKTASFGLAVFRVSFGFNPAQTLSTASGVRWKNQKK